MKLKTKLYEYLLFPISKKEFLIVLEQIVMAVQKLQANSMSISNLVMEVYKVYINRNTKEMQFLYIPISDCPVSDIAEFIECIRFKSDYRDIQKIISEEKLGRLALYGPYKVYKYRTRDSEKGMDSYMITDMPLYIYGYYKDFEEIKSRLMGAAGV